MKHLTIILADPKLGHNTVQVQLGKPSTKRKVDTALEEYRKPGWFMVEETKRIGDAKTALKMLDMTQVDRALAEYTTCRADEEGVTWHIHRVIAGGSRGRTADC